MSTETNEFEYDESAVRRKRQLGRVFLGLCFAATMVGIVALAALLLDVVNQAWGWLTWEFLTYPPSQIVEHYDPSNYGDLPTGPGGMYPMIVGSIYLIVLTAVFTLFLGVGAAIYLEEYAPDNLLTRFIEANISNLAGVPSIVYGLLGLAVFVRAFQTGQSLIAGALTLTLLILPIVIVQSQESLRAVPDSMRQASYGTGATKWQTIRNVILPEAIPGIMTGIILSLSRAIGETAPILMVGAATTLFSPPDLTDPTGPFGAMPMQIFEWAKLPEDEFQHVAAAGIVVLLTALLLMNAVAIYIRNRYDPRS
ncbi:phosphate ABC transporter permease PstA [Natronobacterium gregoryi]|uniref:Phosphate transport system permease protein PstA n=2 Tax=Natronobacterium gregoryi TaxID=44930 RepID=L0AES3_NATGS|nr:phosphate ABC transporter permease PstA [Natronobacterium gregoryi]AFZ71607.1 phosphate ABC transporter, permease protein PstA [Natronobacterium gregoryi SP2]ELY66662.1 phosphate ABC transporter permease [Natronobacterium gregoryi SP2]PLK21374.1 phosphate ABC transporter, permease protein PstA [Natronobacterium gregoryi SP2]SFI80619.1 phosphate ABC transporter membrane protein 2, PhoT family [Natronobacterium gregoryi]